MSNLLIAAFIGLIPAIVGFLFMLASKPKNIGLIVFIIWFAFFVLALLNFNSSF